MSLQESCRAALTHLCVEVDLLITKTNELEADNAEPRKRAAELEELLPDDGRWFRAETVEAFTAEIRKLRKLARKMWKPFCWAQSGYEVCLSDEEDREIRDLARELRIEVDE